jgi:hypothetical protein
VKGKISVGRALGRQPDNIKMVACTEDVGCEDSNSIRLFRG